MEKNEFEIIGGLRYRKCLRCEHQWVARKNYSSVCPKCKSPYWNKAKDESKPLTQQEKLLVNQELETYYKTEGKDKVIVWNNTAYRKCYKCGHEWMPRQKITKQCPHCKSGCWDTY